MAVTDYQYPDIKITDYIDESLPNILARDDAAKNGFRRVSTFPAGVTENDIGMKVYLVGQGNFQLISVDPEPVWKQLTTDNRSPAYTDWIEENYQPSSPVLTSLARYNSVSNAIPYFDGPSDFQTIALGQYMKNMLSLNSSSSVRNYLGLGSLALLNTPINGSNISDGTISPSKLNNDVKQSFGWSTGDVKLTYKGTEDEGWILLKTNVLNTIGQNGSNATFTSKDYDIRALYNLMFDVPGCSFQTSSGATVQNKPSSANAAWCALYRIVLPDMRGRALAMVSSSYSRGDVTGSSTVTLTVKQIPAHTHTTTLKLTHGRDGSNVPDSRFCNGDAYSNDTRTATTNSVGGGQAHNNMQPTVFLRVMIKL